MFPVGKPQEDTMALPGTPGLRNLWKKYSLEILGELGLN